MKRENDAEFSILHRTRKAWHVESLSHASGHYVYAPDASKARAQVISTLRDAWGCSFRGALVETRRVRRAPYKDIVLPPRHPLASSLSEKVLHCVVHANGGKGERAGYRDHFYASVDNWVMRAALWHGLFSEHRRDKGQPGQPDMIMYQLTDLGRNVAMGEVKTYPACWH